MEALSSRFLSSYVSAQLLTNLGERIAGSSRLSIALLVVAGFGVPLAVANLAGLAVLGPLLASTAVVLLFFWTLWHRRRGVVPWFEIGTVYVAVIFVYLTYPLVGFLALGQQYTPANDGRLIAAQPSADEIAAVGWLYVWHLVGFVLAYLAVRGRLGIRKTSLPRPGTHVLVAIVSLFLVVELYELFLGLSYDMSSATYIETYLVARRLPLVLAQLLNHLHGTRYVLALMLMAALFSRYPRSRPVIVAWLMIAAAATLMRLGSRTDLVLLAIAVAMMYDAIVRPLPLRLVAGVAAVGLIGFVAFGIVRNSAAGAAAQSHNPFAYASEFESLLANAVHLSRVRSTIPDLPMAFFLADLAALIPQQFAPFTKISPADWYVMTFFPSYATQGGGLAFGTISEAVLSGGAISALARGVALGVCFAAIHRLHVRNPGSFWVFVFYVWVATLSYQSFRSTTFYLVVLAAFRFLPALVAVNLLGAALRRSAGPGPNFSPSAAVKA